MLDYDSGESLWGNKGKGIEIKGQVVDYAFTDAGIVLTTGFDSNWTDKGTEYLLYVVDGAAGALRFEEPLEVKGRMLTTELIPRGLLYVTSHEINVFDPTSGRLLNEPVLRGKSPLVAANEGDTLFAFNSDDGHLYALDRATGRIAQLSAARSNSKGKIVQPGSRSSTRSSCCSGSRRSRASTVRAVSCSIPITRRRASPAGCARW